MLDHEQVQLAAQLRMQSLAVATTGPAELSATAAGYARVAGSFITDGLRAGMELAASGFTLPGNNGLHVITGVTDLAVSCGGCAVEVAAGGRVLSVGMPSTQETENLNSGDEKTPGVPWFDEQYLPGPGNLDSLGPSGRITGEPMYIARFHVEANTGNGAAVAYARATLALFPPGLVIVLPNGDALKVRGDVAPFSGQLLPSEPGFAMQVVTIPFRIHTTNSI